jgi:GNAT superfamily N-acetyltransferase
MPDFPFTTPRVLKRSDRTADFDCGVEALNRYLRLHALQAQSGDGARTYVTLSDKDLAGYYTLAYGSVEHASAPSRASRGVARHPIPVLLLARLAVDLRFSGRGLGAELLRDALLRTVSAADIAGLRAVVVDAKDKSAIAFYERFGFEPFANDPQRLCLILKDVRALLTN